MDQASLGKIKTNELTVQGAPFSWAPWLTAVSGTLLVFVTLTWLILTSQDIRDFDLSIARTLQQDAHDHSAVRQFFWLVTWVGGIVGLTVLATTGTLTMLFSRRYLLAAIWVLATAGGALVNLAIKETVARVRPIPEMRDESVAHIGNPSFPSGHAMGSAIGMGMCLFVALRFLNGKRAKLLISIGLVMLILLIGFSRIYLRAHWFTDVLGGFTLGASWLVLCLAIATRFRAGAPSEGGRK